MTFRSVWLKVGFIFLVALAGAFAWSGCGDEEGAKAPDDAGLTPVNATCPEAAKPVLTGCTELKPGESLPATLDTCRFVKQAGRYDVEFLNIVERGRLVFVEPEDQGKIDFRAQSILVEAGGILEAGSEACAFGVGGGRLSIGLYGDDPSDQGRDGGAPKGITCTTGGGTCIPDGGAPTYCTGGDEKNPLYPCAGEAPAKNPKNAKFEPYHDHLNFDNSPFGYKTVSVAYGGTLKLFGYKGAAGAPKVESPTEDGGTHCRVPTDPADLALDAREVKAWASLSGSSWSRLVDQKDEEKNGVVTTLLTLDRKLDDWGKGDEIVVGPTDWYPGHYENRTVLDDPRFEGETTVLRVAKLAYPHAAAIFDTEKSFGSADAGAFTQPVNRKAADLRAPVGLLSRSIQIRSLGNKPDEELRPAKECLTQKEPPNLNTVAPNPVPADCYFGGHVMIRQGFKAAQLQGVELKQLGQGGRMGHYPIHFHMTKAAPYAKPFFKDSSVWDSMTRFVTLHGAHGVEVSRNVGYLSTGHGFYLEDASEIDNLLCHNLGVGARAPLEEYYYAQKKAFEASKAEVAPPTARWIPPILDGSKALENTSSVQRFGSDSVMPIMFWVMNGQNEIVGNQASGVHGWGSCYWLLGSALSGMSRDLETFEGVATFNGGYDARKANAAPVGYQAPLRRFRGNSCSSSSQALVTVKDAPPAGDQNIRMSSAKNPYLYDASGFSLRQLSVHDYARPIIVGSFNPINPDAAPDDRNCRAAQQADATVLRDKLDENENACAMTLIDRFTTSFNWTEVNFSSVWLRPNFYVFLNGVVTDQIGAGVTSVTAGDWMQVQPGYFSLIKNSLFVGTSQPNSIFARRSGPIIKVRNGADTNFATPQCAASTCNFDDQGTGYWSTGLNPKRLLNIYDGPAFAEGNTFVNVGAWECNPSVCQDKDVDYSGSNSPNRCQLPCAADEIGKPDCNRELPCGIYQGTTQPSPFDPATRTRMVVPDAAIGWKQENGFYYAPAFAHRRNSFLAKLPATSADPIDGTTPLNRCFAKAPLADGGYREDFLEGDCRHNVVDRRRNYLTGVQSGIRGRANILPRNYPRVVTDKDGGVDLIETQNDIRLPVTPIDFQTILLDLDGTLTGATGALAGGGGVVQPSTSVSGNPFFDAPAQTEECLSFGVQTSPLQYVSSMMALLEGSPTKDSPAYVAYSPGNDREKGESVLVNGWYQPMVGLYRQFLLAGEKGSDCGTVCNGQAYGCPRASFMMGPGVFHTSHLTASVPTGIDLVSADKSEIKSLYYIDTGSAQHQPDACVGDKKNAEAYPARFEENKTYAIYNLFPRNDTKISYSFYVGNIANVDAIKPLFVKVDPHVSKPGPKAVYKQSRVKFECDPSAAGAAGTWCKDDKFVTYKDGIVTVLLDHGKAGKSLFNIKNTSSFERCLTRDLCFFDSAANKCAPCASGDGASCTRKGNSWLSTDLEALLVPDAFNSKPLEDVCGFWSTLASGTSSKTDVSGELSLADCPEGGCLGFVFTLPTGFTPVSYATAKPPSFIFDKDSWNKNTLVGQPSDLLCGPPRAIRDNDFYPGDGGTRVP